jgi:hypothetical protein
MIIYFPKGHPCLHQQRIFVYIWFFTCCAGVVVFLGCVEGEGKFLVVIVIVGGGGQMHAREEVVHTIDKPPTSTPFIYSNSIRSATARYKPDKGRKKKYI